MSVPTYPDTPPGKEPQVVPIPKERPVRFWRDGQDLVAPRQGATFTGRCLVTGKEFLGDISQEFQDVTAYWMPWDLQTLLLHLVFGVFTLWIFGRQCSLTIPINPSWRVQRTLFVTGMLACLLAGVFLTLIFTLPTLIPRTELAFVGGSEAINALAVMAGPCLLGMFVIGFVAGGKLHFRLHVVKASTSFMWIRGADADVLFGLPPWQLSPFAAAERPLPVFARMRLREGILQTDPFIELQAPHVAARATFLLSLWGIPSLFCFLAATALLGLGHNFGPRDEWRSMGFGFGFGVVSLSALWAALGPFRFFTRLPLATLLAMVAIATVAFYMSIMERNLQSEGVVMAVLAGGLQWLGLLVLLIPARLVFGSKVEIPGMGRPRGNQATQFGIRQLLIWTTGVALTLGVLRFVAGQIGLSEVNWQFLAREGIGFAIVLVFNLILAGSLAWALLVQRSIGVRVAIAAFVIVLATLAEPYAFSLLQGGRPSAEIFWWVNFAGSLCLVVNLLIVRLCGYRLVPDMTFPRSPPRSSSYPGPAG